MLQQYNCTCIYIDKVLIKHCVRRHSCCGDFWIDFSEEGGFKMWHRWAIHLLANRLRNILSERAQLVTVLVPPSSSIAAVSKAFTPLPWKSDRSDVELGERRQSHTLRFGKCLLVWKSLACTISLCNRLHKWRTQSPL